MSDKTEVQELEIRPEEEEDEVYIEYEIATYPSDFTLSNIHAMWKDGDIKVPSFQRNYVLVNKAGIPTDRIFFTRASCSTCIFLHR